jgi:hypothetical protein
MNITHITIQTTLIEGIIDLLLDEEVDTAIVRLIRMKRNLSDDLPPVPDAVDDMLEKFGITYNAPLSKDYTLAEDPDKRERRMAADRERKRIAREQAKGLPTMQPIAGKPVKSKHLKCPTCGAMPGTECFEMTSRGRSGKPTTKRKPQGSATHTTRYELAKEANS